MNFMCISTQFVIRVPKIIEIFITKFVTTHQEQFYHLILITINKYTPIDLNLYA